MSELINSNTGEAPSIDHIAETLSEIEKRLDVIDYFRADPALASEQKRAFISGEIDLPLNHYPLLEQTDFANIYADLSAATAELTQISMPDKYRRPYEAQVYTYGRTIDMLDAAQNYNNSHDIDAARAFMEANLELCDEPDLETYNSLVAGLKSDLEQKPMGENAAVVRQELLGMLPKTPEDITAPKPPTPETIEWVHDIVLALYEDFLAVIPDQPKFTATELRSIFDKILKETMGGSTDDWQVNLSEKAKSINVTPSIKEIQIPDNDKMRSKAEVEKLVVHELGVHVMRAVMGDNKNISALSTGMSRYSEAEEGIAVVFEQAIKGEYLDRGVPYYLIAGGAYFHQQDFRNSFEMLWRRNALLDLKPDQDLDQATIDKAKDAAYNSVFRIFRGTNDLPWFKDLTYYNGNRKIWDYLGDHVGDPEVIFQMFQGKIDPTNHDHLQAVWDATLK
jgi:hypothetical protein